MSKIYHLFLNWPSPTARKERTNQPFICKSIFTITQCNHKITCDWDGKVSSAEADAAVAGVVLLLLVDPGSHLSKESPKC